MPAGSITDPNYIAGAQFGASIAIASVERAPDFSPWETSDLEPSWVAVGAPGDERVEVYWVDHTAAAAGTSPFTHAMTLTNPNPTGSTGFGSVVVAANVSNDGTNIPELIVSAPGGPNGGAVWVYEGVLSSPQPLNPVGLQVSRSGDTSLPGVPTMVDSFGAALAAGPIIFEASHPILDQRRRNGLLVGVPTYLALDSGGTAYPDAGAVCQFELGLDGGAPSKLQVVTSKCEDHFPFSAPFAGARVGQSLAVGNFLASDKNSAYYTDASLLNDIAVGVPGMNSGQGEVWVMASQADGLNFLEITTVMDDPFGSPGDAYGESLSSGYVGETLWGDLVIGQSVVESASLSRATAVSSSSVGACPDLTGWWEIDNQRWDSDTLTFSGRTAEVVIWEEAGVAKVIFQKALDLNVSAAGGTVPCSIDLNATGVWGPVCEGAISLALAGGTEPIQYASNVIAQGTILELNSDCTSAYDGLNTYTWLLVPVGDVIYENIDDELWDYLVSANKTALLATTATVSVTLGGAGDVDSLDVVIDWPTVWNNIIVDATLADCPFGFDSSCDSPTTLSSSGSPEYPAAADRVKDTVCED